jgi:hypothetical protein
MAVSGAGKSSVKHGVGASMNPKYVVLALVIAAAAFGATVWLGGSPSTEVQNTPPKEEKTLAPAPIITAQGPFPKAVVQGGMEFNFGAMAVYESRTHLFTVKNEGEVPLKMTLGKTTCKCTLSALKKGELGPGETSEIELEWHPIEAIPDFRQTAEIHTNDPDNSTIKLVVTGRVESRFVVEPHEEMNAGDIAENVPSHVNGVVRSAALDSFKINEVTTSKPQLQATVEPLPPEELEKSKSKSGYRVKATVSPDVPIGEFFESIDLHTDIDGGTKIRLKVRALRRGPIEILAPQVNWSNSEMRLRLGSFLSTEGKKANLMLFVSTQGETADFKILDIASDDEFIKTSFKEASGETDASRRMFLVSTEVPAGSPPLSHTRENPSTLTIKTNLANAPEMKITVEYVAQ